MPAGAATARRAGVALLAALAVVLACLTAAASPVSAATTAGCGKAPSLSTGQHTISSGGQNRTFRLDVPSGYDRNKPYRLVVGLHWWHGTSNDVMNENYYGLKPLSGGSTIFVAPQGIDNAWPNSGGRDVSFIDDILRRVESDLCIDTTQRFALGFSYGGGMSNALACARADVFRAVAILNGAELSGCSGGTQPIAFLGSHGVSDDVLNISMGRSLRDRALRNNGCTAQNAPEPNPGSGTHTRTAYSCRAGYPVVWLAFDGGHAWAARDRNQGQSWVPGEVWQFFTSLTSTTETTPPPTETTPPPTETTPPPTETTPPPTETTPPPATGACTARYTTVNSWPGGFQGEVTVTAGSAGLNGWTATWALASGQGISQAWGGESSVSGGRVSVANAPWNGTLAAGTSTTFGFIGTGSPSTPTVACAAR